VAVKLLALSILVLAVAVVVAAVILTQPRKHRCKPSPLDASKCAFVFGTNKS
jgi:hypothetical protein